MIEFVSSKEAKTESYHLIGQTRLTKQVLRKTQNAKNEFIDQSDARLSVFHL